MFTQLVRVLHNNNLKNEISIMLSVYEKYELCISGFLKIALKLFKKKCIHPKFTMRFFQIVRLAGYHSYMYYVK